MNTPTVAVVVVARNEERYVEACLRSILENVYPATQFRVFFIDDGSVDRTRLIAERLQADYASQLQLLTPPSEPYEWAPKKRAIVHAIRQCDAEIVLLTDADSRVPENWIRSMVSEFGHDTGVVIGASIPTQSRTWLEAFYRFERLFVNYTMCSAIGWGTPASASGQNLAYRRTAFRSLVGFPFPTVQSGDDDLVVQAIAAAGWKVKFASSSESLVEDCRIPELARNLNAAIRHQSVTRYYPAKWRLLYAASIASYGIAFAFTGISLFDTKYFLVAAAIWLAKIAVELPTARIFCKRLGIAVTGANLALSEIILPFYVIVKPMLAVLPQYTWKLRRHATSASAA